MFIEKAIDKDGPTYVSVKERRASRNGRGKFHISILKPDVPGVEQELIVLQAQSPYNDSTKVTLQVEPNTWPKHHPVTVQQCTPRALLAGRPRCAPIRA